MLGKFSIDRPPRKKKNHTRKVQRERTLAATMTALNDGIEDEKEYVLRDFGMQHGDATLVPSSQRERRELAEDKGMVFSALLSLEEANGIIGFLERDSASHWRLHGGQSASGQRDYRNYLRQCFLSTALGDLLVSRLGGTLLPQSMMATRVVRCAGNTATMPKRGEDGVMESADMVGTEGEWEFSRVNPYFRALKYGEGDYFMPHQDGHTSLSSVEEGAYAERSFVTLMLYLNDGFEGGATQFFKDSTRLYEKPSDDTAIIDSVTPAPGQLVAFWHHAVHAGEAVAWPEGEGTHKIALRTEAMFRRRTVAADPLDPEGLGMALLREARELSDTGRYPEAIQRFNRLRYQYPHLAKAEGVL